MASPWSKRIGWPVRRSASSLPARDTIRAAALLQYARGFCKRRKWLRGLDSNQDNQLQRLACYQLHYPGLVRESVADIWEICSRRPSPSILRFAALPSIC